MNCYLKQKKFIIGFKINNKNKHIRNVINHAIIPEFLNIYIKAYCSPNINSIDGYIKSFDNIEECLNTAYIPDINVQSLILENLHQFAMKTDISNFEAPLMKAMLLNNKKYIEDLFNTINDYNLTIDHLKEILYNISIIDNINDHNIL